MARILVLEPYVEVRELLGHVIARLGQIPVLHDGTSPADSNVDAVVFEPASPEGMELVQQLRVMRPDIPLVCTSIRQPSAAVLQLEPVAYLLKPFALSELEAALRTAVTQLSARSVLS